MAVSLSLLMCSEKVDFGTVLLREGLLLDKAVGSGQGDHVDVVVVHQARRLINCVFVAVAAKPGLVHDHVCDVLSVFDRSA